MIPILYDSNETAFQSNGIGRLVDCLRCEVTEERNGIFEVEFDYPITGPLYDEIIEGRIIATIHDDNKDVQPFDIYGRSAPIDGVVTFFAHHVSYRLQYSILQPFTATSCADALEQMVRKCVTPCPFTFWTDKTTAGNFKVSAPVSVKAILGGVQGSILDTYGKGEYEWDKFTVKLHLNRGTDTGVQIRYGKNLVDLTQDVDTSGFYSAVVPYWIGGENESTIVTLPEWVVLSDAATAGTVPTNAVPLDLSDQWDEAPTAADLRAKALARVNSSEAWLPDENIKVDFVALWQTEEYANIAPLEKAKLCDRVSVICPELGLVAEGVQVIKTVCDGLLERYVSMELGKARTSFASVIQAAAEAAILPQVPSKSFLQAVVDELSAEIAAGQGGIIYDVLDANGNRTEMLILCDEGVTPSTPPEQCQHIWRINKAGIGYSDDYGRTYRLAITASGQIVADFITAGTLSANIIHGGTLTLGGANNGNGVFVLLDANGNESTKMDKDGLYSANATLSGLFHCSVMGEYLNHSTGEYVNCVLISELQGGAHRIYRDSTVIGYISPDHTAGESPHYDVTLNEYTGLSNMHICAGGKLTLGIMWNPSGQPTQVLNDREAISLTLEPSQTYYHTKVLVTGKLYYNNLTGGGASEVATVSSSSLRYKRSVSYRLNKELDSHRLYDLKVVQFVYKDGHPLQYADMAGKTLPGFIAEDVADIYPAAVIHGDDGQVESWDERRIIPGLLALVQEQKKEIDELKTAVNELRELIQADTFRKEDDGK